MSAVAVVIVGAVLGGGVQAVVAWADRLRESRAAAQVVWDTLKEAQVSAHRVRERIAEPVFIDFAAYATVWECERKALALGLSPADYATVPRPSRHCESSARWTWQDMT